MGPYNEGVTPAGNLTGTGTYVAAADSVRPRRWNLPVWVRQWSFRLSTVLLPAMVVFTVEFIRHEVLHHEVPEMLGNVLTGVSALVISAVILLPIYRRLEAADARLRATQVDQAVSGERERLARELHDGVAQALFFLNVKAAALERSLDPARGADGGALRGLAHAEGDARAIAAEIAQAVDETAQRVRDAIFDLRTSPEPGEPFDAWVRNYTQRFAETHGLAARVDETGTPRELPLEHQLHAMAIVREALHNVAKHAHARTVTMGIEWSGDALTVTALDDGRGLPRPVPGPEQGRYGIAALSEHARAVGATVIVRPGRDGVGTTVAFRMPYAGGHTRT
jgi:signal transduction histidine kinase